MSERRQDGARKSCESCRGTFDIEPQDSLFYEKISPLLQGKTIQIPAPRFCPECRQQRRLSYRNERNFYHRQCDLSGEVILSTYAPGTQLKVYNHRDWHGDSWDPFDYGQDFDFSRPFFEQFFELHNRVPMMSLDVKSDNENCNFTNLITQSKNCYFTIATTRCEDCLYSAFLQRNNNVVDCFFIFDSELCYQCIDCYSCYQLFYSQDCSNCRDSYFLHQCQACSECFGCVGLYKERFHIFNQPYREAAYREQLKILLANAEQARAMVRKLRMTTPQKHYSGIQNENVHGDHISYSKNIAHCFDCTYLEDSKYCTWFHKSQDCYDCYGWGLGGELGYESHLIGNTFYQVLFSESCWGSVSHLMYCRYCLNSCHNLFACVGLRNKEYCVFNKPYSKIEYEQLVVRIIEHMKETKEWGEFFPAQYSPYAYNESVANDYYPLTPEQVHHRRWRWKDNIIVTSGKETKHWNELPASIQDIPPSIVQEILRCEGCKRNFRITQQELKFYRDFNLPLPRTCFHCRHLQRRAERRERTLYHRFCEQCGSGIETAHAPSAPDIVYCEECYLKERRG